MRKITLFAVVAGLGCFSLGCATGGGGTAAEGAATPIVTYQCSSKTIRTSAVAGTNRINLTLPEGRTVTLTAVDGSSGAKFSDGQVTLVLKDKEASVEFSSERKPITGCVTK